MEILCVVMST